MSPELHRASSVVSATSPTDDRNHCANTVIRPLTSPYNYDDDAVPVDDEDLRVRLHEESGLVVCADGHEPQVVLPDHVDDHLMLYHDDPECTASHCQRLREAYSRGTATNIPPNILTPLPLIPITEGIFCYNCYIPIANRRTHVCNQPSENSLQLLVPCQECYSQKLVVLGPLPEKPLMYVNVHIHEETGLAVCAEGHKPEVVLPRKLEDHLKHHYMVLLCSEAIRDRLREELSKGTATVVPQFVHTQLPEIPINKKAVYCYECGRVYRNFWQHNYSQKCGDYQQVQVVAQLCRKNEWAIVGTLPRDPNAKDNSYNVSVDDTERGDDGNHQVAATKPPKNTPVTVNNATDNISVAAIDPPDDVDDDLQLAENDQPVDDDDNQLAENDQSDDDDQLEASDQSDDDEDNDESESYPSDDDHQLKVYKHDESGLYVCAENHLPQVILPRQIESHLKKLHRTLGEELRERIRRKLQKCTVSEIPKNIYDPIPGLPVERAFYCFNCGKVFLQKKWHLRTLSECKTSRRVRVDTQECYLYRRVILGPVPQLPEETNEAKESKDGHDTQEVDEVQEVNDVQEVDDDVVEVLPPPPPNNLQSVVIDDGSKEIDDGDLLVFVRGSQPLNLLLE